MSDNTEICVGCGSEMDWLELCIDCDLCANCCLCDVDDEYYEEDEE